MQERICCVIYGELGEMVRQVVAEYEDASCSFDIVEGIREENLDKINRSLLGGAEIILAGGANAEVIRGYFNVPVLNYKVTAMDYICAIQTGLLEGSRVALVSYQTPVDSRLKEYLRQSQMPVEEIIYEDTQELEEKLRKSQAEVVVGNGLAVDLAKGLGLKGVLLYYGKDSIRETIEEARLLVREIQKEKERNHLLKGIMDNTPNGVIHLDQEDYIKECNRSMCEILGKNMGELHGIPILDILPGCVPENRGETESFVLRIGEGTYIEQWVPIKDSYGECMGVIMIMALFSDYKRAEVDYRKRQMEVRRERGFFAKFSLQDIIGESYYMRVAKDEAELFAGSDAAVIIYGETGVGKELFAQGIHHASKRRSGPFVAINCAALPDNLLESELFGYDEGAFTGGKKGGKKGLFELADGGSLFLDEIGEISSALQARLLRVIQEKEVMHVGGDRIIPVNVRIITATNKKLEQMEDKDFRRDLLYRLSVLELSIPPLRNREEDVITLFAHFCEKKKRMDAPDIPITPDMKKLLKRYTFKGNIRELQNVCERFCLYMERNTKHNEGYVRRCLIKAIGEEKLVQDLIREYGEGDKKQLVSEIKSLFSYSNEQVAQLLGLSRTTLWRMVNTSKE